MLGKCWYVNLFINPGKAWILLMDLLFIGICYIFAIKKKMEKKQIQALLENASDDFLERFYETLLNEINCDDEPYHKKARQLLLASLNDEHHDDFFIAICGWSLESIIEKI